MSDGTRTRDRLDHNQELYQLSYAHHGSEDRSLATARRRHAVSGGASAAPLAFGEREALAGRQAARARRHLTPGRQQAGRILAEQ